MQNLELHSDYQPTLKMVAPDGKWDDHHAIKIISRNGVAWRELSMEDIAALHAWTGEVLAQRTSIQEAAE